VLNCCNIYLWEVEQAVGGEKSRLGCENGWISTERGTAVRQYSTTTSLRPNRVLAEWFLKEWDRTRPVTVQVGHGDVAVDQPRRQLAVLPTDSHQNIPSEGLILKPIRTRSTRWSRRRSWMGV